MTRTALASRLLAVAPVAALPWAATARAQGFRYAPGRSRYEVAQKTTVTRTAVGQPGQPMNIDAFQRLSITIDTGERDTLTFTLHVDSARIGSSLMGDMDASQLAGLTATGTMAPTGALYAISADSAHDRSVAEQLVRILPVIRRPLAPGASWTDTLKGRVEQNGLSLDRAMVTTETVAGDTTIAGERAWRIARHATMRVSGGGDTPGGRVSVTGTGSGGGFYYVSPGGRLLGADLTDDITQKIGLVGSPMTMDAETHNQVTVRLVR